MTFLNEMTFVVIEVFVKVVEASFERNLGEKLLRKEITMKFQFILLVLVRVFRDILQTLFSEPRTVLAPEGFHLMS